MKLKIEKLAHDAAVKVEFQQSPNQKPIAAELTRNDVRTVLSMLTAADAAAVFRIELQLEGR